MRVLVAFDKFKDALTAPDACAAAAEALRAKHPDWTLDLCPLTDGGEGFAELIADAAQGTLEQIPVTGPRGAAGFAPLGTVPLAKLPAAARGRLGLAATGTIAVAGMASASGLALLKPAERNPWYASSAGTGQLLAAAAARKPAAILLGVGGSATNDLGLGALTALGCQFLDAEGQTLDSPVPATWRQLVRVSGRPDLPPLFIACDVTNPLLGPRGATATFGPQKGLTAADVTELDALARQVADLLGRHFAQPAELTETPGAGAAGGIAFGLMVAAKARLVPGFDLVSDWLDLSARLVAADLVITGEGRFDATSLGGKGPGSLLAGARALGKPAHVFAGALGLPEDAWLHAVTPPGLPLAEALPRSAELLTAAVGRAL